ncbi:hypothetical protein FEM48_Zijuj10G0119500 [Ziziphus jujuba var. spinosa]|uniref:Uncharacterized protein n=1 Tax=Ziziphus jujuba var. spinosa TaxID=714518 RepID=A0A978UN87_ZIZJJ|nr:hypothetical protein FEM48_Zijuj10G0119500 [Ziziphus jujuba var. spinosa]
MLDRKETDKLSQLELIDVLQRLGLSYYFEELKSILKGLHEAFNAFKDKIENFMKDMSEDTMGMLSLYEASYYLTEGENILEDARDFTTKNLKEYIEKGKDENEVCILVRHALELPLHWRVPRLEDRWFIDVYERRQDMNPVLLELAKLDFNWTDLCNSYLREAKWYYSGYTPSFEEYMENAWISISAPVVLVHTYFSVSNPITQEALQCLEDYPNILRWPSMIFRLADDLGTSSGELERGDVPKSTETGVSEDDARKYIKFFMVKYGRR